MADDDIEPPKGPDKAIRPCPICRKPAVETTKPFCSKRCADVDLHRWLGGVYALPADMSADDLDGLLDEGES